MRSHLQTYNLCNNPKNLPVYEYNNTVTDTHIVSEALIIFDIKSPNRYVISRQAVKWSQSHIDPDTSPAGRKPNPQHLFYGNIKIMLDYNYTTTLIKRSREVNLLVYRA